jgi:Mg-chelatase subunit ChlD
MEGMKLERVKAGVRSIVEKLRPGQDQLAVSAFNSSCEVVTKRDDSFDAILRASDSLVANGSTSLYDAIVQSVKSVKSTSTAAPHRRYGLIVLTDGDDNDSKASLEDATSAITEPGIDNFFCVFMLVNVDEKCKERIASIAGSRTHVKIEDITTVQGTSITNCFAAVSDRASKPSLSTFDPRQGSRSRTRNHSTCHSSVNSDIE